MNGWTLTKVWLIDHKLVVADTIEEAIALFKKRIDNSFYEPKEIKAVSADVYKDYDALIKE